MTKINVLPFVKYYNYTAKMCIYEPWNNMPDGTFNT